ncbi:hypothetical protein [Nonomuraea africana]|uniref:hypothetical protein n=1 Tax=Nonomuraea africana TaxID=46171 RepID=UPI00340104BA
MKAGTAERRLALRGVGQARKKIVDAESEEVRAVAAARAAGATWEEIPAELGILQPNAVRKYGHAVKAILAGGFTPVPALRTITAVSHYVTGFLIVALREGYSAEGDAAFERAPGHHRRNVRGGLACVNPTSLGPDPVTTSSGRRSYHHLRSGPGRLSRSRA